MNYLIVEDGMIENIIVADAEFAAEVGAFPTYDGARIGEAYSPPPPPPTVEDDLLETALDHEARLSALELLGGGEI